MTTVAGDQISDPDPAIVPASAATGGDEDDSAPPWFELLTLAGIVTLAAVGVAGLLFAVIGRYSTVATLAVGLPVAAVAVVMLRRGLPRGGQTRRARLCAAVALAIGIGYAVLAGSTPSENVVVNRDGGAYLTTARQLVREGALEVDARGAAFAGIGGLQFSGAAVYDMGDPYRDPAPAFQDALVPQSAADEEFESGLIEPQFNHLAAVELAVAYDVGTQWLMFRLPALVTALALLALYAVTVRVTHRPDVSLLAMALFAVSLPLLYVARNTYSESFAFALLWGAVLCLVGLHRRPRASMAVVGGALLGALVCTRIDSLLYVGLLFPLVAVSLAAAGPAALRLARVRAWGVTLLAVAVVGALGWYDLAERSGDYAAQHAAMLGPLRWGLVAAAVISAVGLAGWLLVPQIRHAAQRLSAGAAVAGAVVVAGALLLGWLVRPHLQIGRLSSSSGIAASIQRTTGQPVDPTRSYAEQSLQWMAWYLGPVALVAAIGGLTWATWRALRGRAEPAVLALLVLCLGSGALYFYDPNITPDQLWASRRFVPAILPSLALWSTAAFALLLRRPMIAGRTAPARAAVAGVTAALLLVPAALTTAPLVQLRLQAGYLAPLLQTCQAVRPDAAIIVLGEFGGYALPQSVRNWCGVPVAAAGTAVTPQSLPAVAERIRANGYRPYLLSPDIRDLDEYVEVTWAEPESTAAVPTRWRPESTLDRPPSSYVERVPDIPQPVPFALHWLEVPTG